MIWEAPDRSIRLVAREDGPELLCALMAAAPGGSGAEGAMLVGGIGPGSGAGGGVNASWDETVSGGGLLRVSKNKIVAQVFCFSIDRCFGIHLPFGREVGSSGRGKGESGGRSGMMRDEETNWLRTFLIAAQYSSAIPNSRLGLLS